MATEKMTDREINVILDAEMRDSVGVEDDKLASDQGEAMDRYMGKLYGTEMDGRSQYVSRDVMDTVEWMMPTLMDIYYSTDEPVVIQPQGEDDIEAAEQETKYLAWLLNRRNDGFSIIHNFIKDGLINKIGVVKHWFDEDATVTEEVYEGLDDQELEALLSKSNVQVVEHTVFDAASGEELEDITGDVPLLHDVRVAVESSKSKITLSNTAPENFRIARRGTSAKQAPYMSETQRVTVSDLISMGFDREIIEGIARRKGGMTDHDRTVSPQFLARFQNDSTDPRDFLSDRTDLANMELQLEEHYVKLDMDGDGIAEIRQIFRIGKDILSNEVWDSMPFTVWSPIMMPHKTVGLSLVDLVQDLQRIKTHLVRAMLDNVNFSNNGGFAIQEGMVNIDDLMTTRPLKIIREKVPNALRKLDTPNLPPEAFQMLQYIDTVREDRSGVSGLSKGQDDQALGSNTAAMSITQMMTAAQQRIQLIARVLAETGLREIYRAMHKLSLQHGDKETRFKLNGKFIQVDPTSWRTRDDFTVTVGTGFANKDQKMLHLNMLTQDTAQIVAAGGLGTLITPQNIYELQKAKYEAAGFKDFAKFITDPATQPPPQEEGPSAEEQLAQLEAQVKIQELQIKQAKLQIEQQEAIFKQMESQARIQKMAHDAQIDVAELELKFQELDIEREQKRAVGIG